MKIIKSPLDSNFTCAFCLGFNPDSCSQCEGYVTQMYLTYPESISSIHFLDIIVYNYKDKDNEFIIEKRRLLNKVIMEVNKDRLYSWEDYGKT